MIARVKIAPIERWCDETRKMVKRYEGDELEASSGSEIHIDTDTMQVSPFCSGRAWIVACIPSEMVPMNPETGEVLDIEKSPGIVCEHMLELD
jgi:hypothetical protein